MDEKKEEDNLTAKDFKEYRKKLFLHPFEAARALGVGYNALNHWESGRRKVPESAVLLLRCIEAAREKAVIPLPENQGKPDSGSKGDVLG